MLTMGDEVRRTQLGNNNAYCQDSELSWFDWGARRSARRPPPLLPRADRRAAGGRALFDAPADVTLAELLGRSRVDWHGTRLGQPDTSDTSRSIAIALWGEHLVLHLILNAYWEPLDFELPAPAGHGLAPDRRHVAAEPGRPRVGGGRGGGRRRHLPAGPRSVVVLAARRRPIASDHAAAAAGGAA